MVKKYCVLKEGLVREEEKWIIEGKSEWVASSQVR